MAVKQKVLNSSQSLIPDVFMSCILATTLFTVYIGFIIPHCNLFKKTSNMGVDGWI